MRIKMLNDCPGSRDGLSVENFRKGMEYDVPDDLAKCFIESKSAKDMALVEKTETVPTIEEPVIGTETESAIQEESVSVKKGRNKKR